MRDTMVPDAIGASAPSGSITAWRFRAHGSFVVAVFESVFVCTVSRPSGSLGRVCQGEMPQSAAG